MTTVQRNYELSETTRNPIDYAYTALMGEVPALRKGFEAEPAAWQSSDAGAWVADWLKGMERLRGVMQVAERGTNPLTDGCVSFDEDGNEIDEEDED